MSSPTNIPDLGEKIALLLKSGRTSVKTESQLLQGLGIGKDMLSRIKGGTRVLSDDRFVKLCDLFNLEQKEWFSPLDAFSSKLGFTRYQIALITGKQVPGIDFQSRIAERRVVENLFRTMEGFWQSFYYSVSKLDRIAVRQDIMHVKRVNEDGFIECDLKDSHCLYVGWGFPITNAKFYLVLEKEGLFDEIIIYCTNLPERMNPRLYGVILCLSGGVDSVQAVPCAAKCAFRFLGREEEVRKQFGWGKSIDVRAKLFEEQSKYIFPDDFANPKNDEERETAQIIRDISNVIPADQVPSSLRMVK